MRKDPRWWTNLLRRLGFVRRKQSRKRPLRMYPALRTEFLEIRVPVSDAAFGAAITAAVMGQTAYADMGQTPDETALVAPDLAGSPAPPRVDYSSLPPVETQVEDGNPASEARGTTRSSDSIDTAEMLVLPPDGQSVAATVGVTVGVNLGELPDGIQSAGCSVGDDTSAPQPAGITPSAPSAGHAGTARVDPSASGPFGGLSSSALGDASGDSLLNTPPGSGELTAQAVSGEESSAIATVSSQDEATPALVPVRLSDAVAVEGRELVFTVTLASKTDRALSVGYQTANGTATADDYVPQRGTLTFAPGETEKTIAVPTINNDSPQSSRHIWMVLSDPDGVEIANGLAVGSILDNDRLPVVSIHDQFADGDENATFLVSLSNPYESPVTVSYTAIEGATAAGAKAQAVCGTITFQPGETVVPLPLSTLAKEADALAAAEAELTAAAAQTAAADADTVPTDVAASAAEYLTGDDVAANAASAPLGLAKGRARRFTVSLLSPENATLGTDSAEGKLAPRDAAPADAEHRQRLGGSRQQRLLQRRPVFLRLQRNRQRLLANRKQHGPRGQRLLWRQRLALLQRRHDEPVGLGLHNSRRDARERRGLQGRSEPALRRRHRLGHRRRHDSRSRVQHLGRWLRHRGQQHQLLGLPERDLQRNGERQLGHDPGQRLGQPGLLHRRRHALFRTRHHEHGRRG